MAETTITLKIDTKLKNECENLLNGCGIDLSTAINIFMQQVCNNGGMLFEEKAPTAANENYSKPNLTRREYCEMDGIYISYNDENVSFEDIQTADAILISNNGNILQNNFDTERTAYFMEWFHRIYDSIVEFRTLDRLEAVV